MSRARGRPRRGNPQQLVPGDVRTLIEGGPGDYAPSSEERTHHNFEAITEPADIPGGKPHLVNRQTIPHRPDGEATDRRRPIDVHREHDVPPEDWDRDYDVPRTLVHKDIGPHAVRLRMRPESEAREPNAVPVYLVQQAGDKRKIRKLAAYNVEVPFAGQEPARICNVDPERVEIRILNEDSATDIRFSSDLEELGQQSAQGTGPAGSGALLWHGTNSYTDLKTQDEIWAITTSSSNTARMSVVIITEEWATI